MADEGVCRAMDDRRALEPDPPFRFLNHSCDPNCEIVREEKGPDAPRLIVVTLAPLRRGAQLTIDYGWLTVIAVPLFWVLAWLYHWVGNWGVAIILLTVMVRVVTTPLTMKQMRSMERMRACA